MTARPTRQVFGGSFAGVVDATVNIWIGVVNDDLDVDNSSEISPQDGIMIAKYSLGCQG